MDGHHGLTAKEKSCLSPGPPLSRGPTLRGITVYTRLFTHRKAEHSQHRVLTERSRSGRSSLGG